MSFKIQYNYIGSFFIDTELLLIYIQENNFWNLKKKKRITAAKWTELSHTDADQRKGQLVIKVKHR